MWSIPNPSSFRAERMSRRDTLCMLEGGAIRLSCEAFRTLPSGLGGFRPGAGLSFLWGFRSLAPHSYG